MSPDAGSVAQSDGDGGAPETAIQTPEAAYLARLIEMRGSPDVDQAWLAMAITAAERTVADQELTVALARLRAAQRARSLAEQQVEREQQRHEDTTFFTEHAETWHAIMDTAQAQLRTGGIAESAAVVAAVQQGRAAYITATATRLASASPGVRGQWRHERVGARHPLSAALALLETMAAALTPRSRG